MSLSKIQRWALYLFFFSLNFEVFDPLNTGGIFSVSKLTGLIYFGSILPNVNQFLSVKNLKPILKPIWFFFIFLTLVSLININSVSYGFFNFSIFQNIILLWILVNHERKIPGVLTKGMFSFALGSIVLAILFHLGLGLGYAGDRVTLFGDNQNIVGIRMSISTGILILIILQNPIQLNRLRYLLFAALPFMLKLMAETGSRVAFISFVLMFLLGVFMYRTKKSWHKIGVLILGSLAFLGIILYILQSEVIMTRLLLVSETGDLAERDMIWKGLLPLIKSNPIIGVGETGYAEFSQKVFSRLRSPHNVIIEIICYTGFIGLIAYLLFIFRSLRNGYRVYKYRKKFMPILLMVPMAGLLLSGQILTNKISWAIFAYAFALGICYSNEDEFKATCEVNK